MSFDINFEKELLSVALKNEIEFQSLSRTLKAGHFTTPEMKWLWSLAEQTVNENREVPSRGIVTHEARQAFSDEEFASVLKTYDQLIESQPSSPETLKASAIEFAKQLHFKEAHDRADMLYEQGKPEEAMRIIQSAYDSAPKESKLGYEHAWWFEEFDQRQLERKDAAENPDTRIHLSTGFPGLDKLIGGGYKPGDMFQIMGATNRGKSIMGVHFAYTNVQNNFGGIYFSTEMHHSRISARLDSRYTGLLHEKFHLYDFSEREKKAILSKLEKDKERLKGLLKIVSMPNQTTTRGKILECLARFGPEIKNFSYFVFDCMDHLQAQKHIRDHRLGQADNAWWLDTLLEEEKLAGVLTTQSNREGAQWTNNETASETYVRSQCADFIVALNQRDQKRVATPKHMIPEGEKYSGGIETGEVGAGRSEMVLSLTKARDGARGEITVETDLARMLFMEKAGEQEDSEARRPIVRKGMQNAHA